MRKIAVITGTRADYGIYKPLLNKIREHSELTLSLMVVGMHFLEEFGCTVREIEKDGFIIDAKITGLYNRDSRFDMARSAGEGIIKLAEVLEKHSPDVMVILGDRGEMLAAAVAATYLGIPLAHIHGGEVSGSVDGVVRHAITKLAHIHLAATEKSAERIKKMGENPDYVFVVGAPGLDSVVHGMSTPPETLQKYGIDGQNPYILVMQHPVTTEVESAAEQMQCTLEAVALVQKQAIVIYPNADAGGRKMIEVIKEYERKVEFILSFRSIPHTEYLWLLRGASCLVGNSSSGIIEAPSLGVPVVNIGTRQRGRERAQNVVDVGYTTHEIRKAIEKALYDTSFREKVKRCENPYGDGNASERIVKILSEIAFDTICDKRLMY
jgi:GDP/UDP-N,N'-diacetylbacillosamine 2-epimerase (hydrolysing)